MFIFSKNQYNTLANKLFNKIIKRTTTTITINPAIPNIPIAPDLGFSDMFGVRAFKGIIKNNLGPFQNYIKQIFQTEPNISGSPWVKEPVVSQVLPNPEVQIQTTAVSDFTEMLRTASDLVAEHPILTIVGVFGTGVAIYYGSKILGPRNESTTNQNATKGFTSDGDD